MSLGVVAQHGNDRAVSLAHRIRDDLGSDRVTVDEKTGESIDVPGANVSTMDSHDLVVSIGGDGTFLFAARHLEETPLMGINLGEVGFLTAVSPESAIDAVRETYHELLDASAKVRTVPRIIAKGDKWAIGPALNEVMVHAPQRGMGHRMSVTVHVDGDVYDTSRVDGVMVSTPSGSTAYNLSERGPLLAPGVEGLVVNQMCASEGRPPLVVPLDAEISMSVTDADFAFVLGDGRTQQRIAVPNAITITRSNTPLRVAGPQNEFFEALDRLQ